MHKQFFTVPVQHLRHAKAPVTGYRRGSRQIAVEARRQRRAR